MKAHTVAPGGCAHTHTSSGWIKRWLPLAFAALASPMFLSAQESAPVAGADKQTIQMLMQRIEKLEARVAQLEGTRGATAQVQAAVAESENIISDPPRVLDIDMARKHMAALDRLPRPTLVTCRAGPRSSAVVYLYAGLRAGASAAEVLARAEADAAPFVGFADLREFVTRGLAELATRGD